MGKRKKILAKNANGKRLILNYCQHGAKKAVHDRERLIQKAEERIKIGAYKTRSDAFKFISLAGSEFEITQKTMDKDKHDGGFHRSWTSL
ncbi:MAG: hypothetical protein OXE77_08370 [Flavobacteriaceae bacterium]|nr:hypothetical protein [Flavobacteriaceae bacterium]MCY4267738.1 hypothetical protein [Flavobacteriaceae bacterium]MCY4298455.1 hypothetical protein [Flavobacteriaceae bacterium]